MRRTTEVVFETARTAKGMDKRDTALFHLWNPNGLREQFPGREEYMTCDRDAVMRSLDIVYTKYGCPAVDLLEKIAEEPHKFTWRQINYALDSLKKRIDVARRFIAENKAA